MNYMHFGFIMLVQTAVESTSMCTHSGSSMDHNFESFQYTDHSNLLLNELNQRTWPNVTGTLNVNLSYSNFVCIFQDLLNTFYIVKRILSRVIIMQVIHGQQMDRQNSCKKQISYTNYSYRMDNGHGNKIKTYKNNRTGAVV